MMRIIAVANHKGGVGKTVTSLNLGHAFAGRGERQVLLCDLDPQASLTKLLAFEPERLPATLYDLLVDTRPGLQLAEVVRDTPMPGVRLLPAHTDLAKVESQLVSRLNRERVLQRLLRPLTGYDFVVIDCPPALNLLTTNALAAADEVIIPVESDFLALQALEAFLATTEEIRQELNPNLHIGGILITKHQPKTGHARRILESLREAFPESLCQVVIPYAVGAKDSVEAAQSILSYDPTSPVAEAYRSLAVELMHHV